VERRQQSEREERASGETTKHRHDFRSAREVPGATAARCPFVHQSSVDFRKGISKSQRPAKSARAAKMCS